ncbi:hypothetical protein M569_13164 [Genlisea aurea]|uniref:Ty3 transposon capsid-like protein domain-containing protein n=1 Tax=Genlisea aurea TaxID=192259 RepID=S8DPD8_9LAMI|nr:hypothetical protein M569_13164 [Genlisea aurea]
MEEVKDLLGQLTTKVNNLQNSFKEELEKNMTEMEQRMSAEMDSQILSLENSVGHKGYKLEVPKYTGVFDPHSWLKKCEYVFDYHGVPDEVKISIAAVNLEGKALSWYLKLNRESPDLIWYDFIEQCELRFEPRQRQDALDKLSRLEMGANLEEYNHQFEELLLNIEDLNPRHELIMYVRGLPAELASMVKLQNPRSITDAMSLATVVFKGNPRRYINKKDRTEMMKDFEDRKSKGLCFHCDEKFTPGHKCKRLFMIEF